MVGESSEERVAGGGLLHRRALLRWSVGGASGLMAGEAGAQLGPSGSMLEPGAPLSPLGARGAAAERIRRIVPELPFPGTGSSRTPLQFLEGTVTPNDVHFERHHNGIPTIEAGTHELLLRDRCRARNAASQRSPDRL